MKRVLIILWLLVVTVPGVAQTNGEIFQALIQLGGSESDSVRELEVMYRFDQACDYDNPVTRGYAMQIAKPALSNTITIAQICDIFDAVRPPHWSYFPDPYGLFDTIAKASDSISLGLKGDCDDFAVLVASCIRAIGGACRIFVVEGSPSGHAFAAVFVGDSASGNKIGEYIRQRYKVVRDPIYGRFAEGEGWWLPLDWGGTPPDWTDAYPGRQPVLDPDTASHAFSVPGFSLAARFARVPLPIPVIP